MKLFTPIKVGNLTLPNRVVMAPMTRSRAVGNVINPSAATYYGQRSSAGLIVTEASQICAQGIGYPDTPGIHTEAQVSAWKKITAEVHSRGGRIFLQLWHVGRISHPLFQPNGDLPVSASAVAPKGSSYTHEGMKEFVTPRALEIAEIKKIVEQYAQGARNAKHAGFDGVEIHGANGYLIDQFLRDGTNKRTDAYGGSIANRLRFALEVVDAVRAEWDQTALRISPSGAFNDMYDSDPLATFGALARELDQRKLAYLHLVEPGEADIAAGQKPVRAADLRPLFHGPLMVNAGYTAARAEQVLAAGNADLVSFGQSFLANPDLPRRLRDELTLNPANPKTFYGGTEAGYTDYPFVD